MFTCHKSESLEYRASSKECPDCPDSCGKAHPNSGLHLQVTTQIKRKSHPTLLWLGLPLAAELTTLLLLLLWMRIPLLTAEPAFLNFHCELGPGVSKNLLGFQCQTGTAEAPRLLKWKTMGYVFLVVSQFHPLLGKTVTVRLFWLMKQLPSPQFSGVILLLLL